MAISAKDIEQRMDRFKKDCRSSGAKLTHQRLEIFREVAGAADHPDADAIYRRVRQRIPTVSLDTVYRTLWWLTDLGLITVLGPPRERARFDANLEHHHHFACTECGLTRDFYSDEFDSLEFPDSILSIGQGEKIQVEVKGLCNQCAAQQQKGINKTNQETDS